MSDGLLHKKILADTLGEVEDLRGLLHQESLARTQAEKALADRSAQADRLRSAVQRIREWDMLDSTADGPILKKYLDDALAGTSPMPSKPGQRWLSTVVRLEPQPETHWDQHWVLKVVADALQADGWSVVGAINSIDSIGLYLVAEREVSQ